ncbi:hypothetical protein R6Q59_009975 [Mikania micrantha]
MGSTLHSLRSLSLRIRYTSRSPVPVTSICCYTRPPPQLHSHLRPLSPTKRFFSSTTTLHISPKMAAQTDPKDHILTLSCPDKPGIVHAVTGIFAQNQLNILDLQQFSDPISQKFFMRVHFGPAEDYSSIASAFSTLARQLSMTYDLRPVSQKPKVLIMVSKIGHCLNDLLFRHKTKQLNIDIPLIISNHAEFSSLAAQYGIAFHHLPVTSASKHDQESRILSLIEDHGIELVVLARYMQVLSPRLCSAMSGKIINIHHSFLPSFKGAKPYHQAFERGVKIIGATAHFVTADLDEGPIIEQRVARVDHAMSPKELVEEGSNVESLVLAAAVKWWSERRVFLNGSKTVVFN